MTNILGISAFYHDSAAALVQGRRDRRRRAGGALHSAQARSGLSVVTPSSTASAKAGIGVRRVDYVVFYEKPLVKFERLLETYLTYAPLGFASFRAAMPVWARCEARLAVTRSGTHWVRRSAARSVSPIITSRTRRARFSRHRSPRRRFSPWTPSANGRRARSASAVATRSRLSHEHAVSRIRSACCTRAFTYYTGFKVNSGEYKLMGLAPYGTPRYADLIRERLVTICDDGSLWLDMSYFNYCQGLTMTSEKFHELFGGPPRAPESFITQKEMDLAASIQVVCEEVVLRAGRHAHAADRSDEPRDGRRRGAELRGERPPAPRRAVREHLDSAGGRRCRRRARRRAARVASRAWKAAPGAVARRSEGFAARPGVSQRRHPPVSRLRRRATTSASPTRRPCSTGWRRLLAEEKIIGWFQGRMEFGPRALGCRSIIGDARSPRMQQKMNLKIKFRESFRPFAPCVLREHVDEYSRCGPSEDSPYMLLVAPVRREWRTVLGDEERRRMQDPDLRIRVAVPRSRIPAITHVDYSARVQTVDAARHGRFHRLMQRFHALDRLPGHRQHQLQHSRRADRLHAGRCVPVLHRHRHGRPGARELRASEGAPAGGLIAGRRVV